MKIYLKCFKIDVVLVCLLTTIVHMNTYNSIREIIVNSPFWSDILLLGAGAFLCRNIPFYIIYPAIYVLAVYHNSDNLPESVVTLNTKITRLFQRQRN